MKIRLIALGTKMPAWVSQGCDEYLKRLRGQLSLELVELPIAKRSKNTNAQRCMAEEAEAVRKVLRERERLVALDVKGKVLSTEALAGRLSSWKMDGQNIAILIGGPDGIAADLLAMADEKWSLSAMTMPHPIVRIILAEQLYRASSINNGHPYHRE